ncbi:FtsX-like permease family protein [uncultured Dubosiella sp.]|uniref:FtsX-like permease family protein n=1 Tax=uncultured Dubosiella sp. TaxID=1937011 RepID=UPI0025B408AD|nr:ABC transporter permease [uncultured Dubosiella sp.]
MISFIWYASNVFLKNQKKEIGIYVFLGLTNTRIGMLYAIENLLVGLVSIVAGIVLGTLFSYLFTMVFVRMSALGVAPQFSISVQAIAQTALLFSLIYGLVTLKGMWEIRRSTVLHLISAARQNEKVARRSGFLLAKALLGCATLGIGYAFAIKDGGMDVLANAMIATVCVIVGTYWLLSPLSLSVPAKKQALSLWRPARLVDQQPRLPHETKLPLVRDGMHFAHLRRDRSWMRIHVKQSNPGDA